MGARRIARIINARLAKRGEVYTTGKNKGKLKTVGKTMITDHLKGTFDTPRKIQKVFFLSKEQKDTRLKFCQKIIEKQIKEEDIFFYR